MYFGEYSTVVDEKGRITVPSAFREIMSVMKHHVWYMTRGFDGAIFLFNQTEWEKIRAQAGRFGSMNARALDFRRLFFSGVAEVQPDRQGRVPVPVNLREHAGLGREAVLLGVDDHLELWSRDAWRAFQEGKQAEYKEMATQLFDAQEEPGAAGEGRNGD